MKPRIRVRRAACCIGAVGLIGLAAPPIARGAEPDQHLNEEGPGLPTPLPALPPDGFVLPPATPLLAPPTGAPTRRVHLESVVFRGNSVVSDEDLAALARPYLGRDVSAADLEAIRRAATQLYIDRGYINSGALFPADAFQHGTLAIDIVEGRLSLIRLAGLDGLSERYITTRLDETDRPLNVEVLRDRFQLLLADPLISQMNARLVPGDTPGSAELDVDVVRAQPYQVTTYFNNDRPPSIGAEAFGVRASARDLTGQGDLLELSEETPLEGAGRVDTGVHWRMPIVQPGTALLVQYDHGDAAVTQEPVAVLGIQSVLTTKALGVEQTLFETLGQRLALSVVRLVRENRTELLGQPFSFIPGEPDGDTEAPAWRIVQDYAYRTTRSVLALRSTFTFVKDNEQSVPGLPASATPDRDYSIWLGQAQYALQVLDNGAQWVVRGTVQATHGHVLPLDAMSIGGDATVRGYRENQLLSDSGQILNLEFHDPVWHDRDLDMELALIPFYDVGHGVSKGVPGQTLSAAGVAAGLHWGGAELDVSKAYRLSYPEAAVPGGGDLQDRGIYVQLQYTARFR